MTTKVIVYSANWNGLRQALNRPPDRRDVGGQVIGDLLVRAQRTIGGLREATEQFAAEAEAGLQDAQRRAAWRSKIRVAVEWIAQILVDALIAAIFLLPGVEEWVQQLPSEVPAAMAQLSNEAQDRSADVVPLIASVYVAHSATKIVAASVDIFSPIARLLPGPAPRHNLVFSNEAIDKLTSLIDDISGDWTEREPHANEEPAPGQHMTPTKDWLFPGFRTREEVRDAKRKRLALQPTINEKVAQELQARFFAESESRDEPVPSDTIHTTGPVEAGEARTADEFPGHGATGVT